MKTVWVIRMRHETRGIERTVTHTFENAPASYMVVILSEILKAEAVCGWMPVGLEVKIDPNPKLDIEPEE